MIGGTHLVRPHRRRGGGYKCAGGGGVVSINSNFKKRKRVGTDLVHCPACRPPRRRPSVIPYPSRGRGRGRRRRCVAVVVVAAVDSRVDGGTVVVVVVVVVVDRAWEPFLVCLGSRGQTWPKVTYDSLYLDAIRGQMAQQLSAGGLLTCTGSTPACAYFFWVIVCNKIEI